MRLFLGSTLLACAIGLASPLAAQPLLPGQAPDAVAAPGGVIQKVTAEQVLLLLNELGFSSRIASGENNTQFIVSQFWNAQVYSGVFLEQCDRGGCYVMRFFVNMGKDQGMDQAWMNGWNARMLMVRAARLPDGNAVLMMDASVRGGVTTDYVKLAAQNFISVVNSSANFKP
jgi:hypothetical protein